MTAIGFPSSQSAARSVVKAAPLIVPSQRVADYAARLGYGRLIVASGAGDEAMLSEVERLAES